MNYRDQFRKLVLMSKDPDTDIYHSMSEGDFFRRMFFLANGDPATGSPTRLSNEGLRIAKKLRKFDKYQVSTTARRILFLNRKTKDLWYLGSGFLYVFGDEDWLVYFIFSGNLDDTIKNN